MSTYYVYILRSKRDSNFYIGLTQDLQRRFHEHNAGRMQATKGRIPFDLVHTESFPSRQEARNREKYLKSGQGRDWIYREFR